MNTWFCLTPNMLNVIASCSAIVYFVDPSRCVVKMNGIKVSIVRDTNEWFAGSTSQAFYDLLVRCGKSSSRGDVVRLSELQMFGVLTHIANRGGEVL
jgi:hypothetical protein